MTQKPVNFLCISTYFKGVDFLKTCSAEGNNVYLLTLKNLEKEDWPFDAIKDVFYIEEWVDEHVKDGLAYLFRSVNFDRIVALDDFDVEKAALLREHFRIPGMGQTTGRYFRDKLAMRIRAHEANIPVPAFTSLFNDDLINAYLAKVPAPWLIKPRHEASAHGIKKVHSKDELWQIIHDLGDKRHHYLVEKFAPGDVFHVDSLNFEKEVIFSRASKYLDTPFEVAHGGGIFRSQTIEMGSPAELGLTQINKDVMRAFGMNHGASHSEFIRSSETGEIFFLETSSRVGGANLAEMVLAASSINLWSEWARIENCKFHNINYQLPEITVGKYAGIVVSLCRFENPDLSRFTDSEIVWRMNKPWHIGLIVASSSSEKVLQLLDKYAEIIAKEYHASAPAPDHS